MPEAPYLSATRLAYDTVAVAYAEQLRTALAGQPMDRAMLGVFAEYVQNAGGGPIVDIGCGPGRITVHLDSLGLSARGIDLSPEMVAVARRSYPNLRFDEGSMTALDLPDGALAGVVAWYSIIHIPPDVLPTVFAEFRRVLAPGGELLMAFQVGDELRHLREGYGHQVSLDAFRLPPEGVAALLAEAGFVLRATVVREPEGPEKVQQAYLLAHRT